MTLQDQIHRLWAVKSDNARLEEIIVILSELLNRIEELENLNAETKTN